MAQVGEPARLRADEGIAAQVIELPPQGLIARLDVVAHRFIYYAIPTPGSEPLGIVMGAKHTLWFTEVDKIGMLQP